MSAVQILVRVVARPSARRELLQALLDWAAAARSAPGLHASNVYEDVETQGVFGLVADWEGQVALDAHLLTDTFGFLLGALDVLTRTAHVSVTRAMDEFPNDALPTIRRLRHRAADPSGSHPS